jgi:hypothetical protein
MKELLHARAMESMCRQRASFFPEESWKFLAEAERWKHRALDLISDHHVDCNQPALPDAAEPSNIHASR